MLKDVDGGSIHRRRPGASAFAPNKKKEIAISRAALVGTMRDMSLSRRRLIQFGSLGLGIAGLSLPAILRAEKKESPTRDASRSKTPRAKSCILLYMDGGPSHI